MVGVIDSDSEGEVVVDEALDGELPEDPDKVMEAVSEIMAVNETEELIDNGGVTLSEGVKDIEGVIDVELLGVMEAVLEIEGVTDEEEETEIVGVTEMVGVVVMVRVLEKLVEGDEEAELDEDGVRVSEAETDIDWVTEVLLVTDTEGLPDELKETLPLTLGVTLML